MDEQKYRPNLITYGVLSLGCKTKEEAAELIEAMKACNYRLNAEILGTMLKQGCYHVNFKYVMYIMDLCESEEVRPNKKFIETLEEFKKRCRDLEKSKVSYVPIIVLQVMILCATTEFVYVSNE
nr:unnamed protein product [Callosobruchus analis]